MIFSFSDLLEAIFPGSVGRTKKKKVKISIFIMSIDEKKEMAGKLFFSTGRKSVASVASRS